MYDTNIPEQVKGASSINGFKEQLAYTMAAPRYPY